MKILLTGGGSGGHFYPVIAVAAEIHAIVAENKIIRPELYYMSTSPYNEGLLYENSIIFKQVTSGKIRRSLSPINIVRNFLDLFKIAWGCISAVWQVYVIYPDVVFGKGGFATFPALFAARLLRIPVIIHESDTLPGKVNAWAGKFAVRIATSYPDSAQFFPAGKTAYTGNPIRKELLTPLTVGAHEFLHLEEHTPTVLILGGSQGAQAINEVVIDALPELVKKFQIIHQTGKKNITVIEETRNVILASSEFKDRYKPYDYLNLLTMRMAAGVADIIISRAGSTIFEIASWGKASIIIPIPEPTSHDQRTNAYAYARSGASEVIEEKNLTSHLLISEITRIVEHTDIKEKMQNAATAFARQDSARLIAQEILNIALSHEK